MKVGELISELQKFDSEAEVGCGLSKLSGWAQKIDDILMSEEGIVFINMGRETIGENELTLASTKVNLSKIASRIAAANTAYRVITDEPVGITIGFEPKGFEYDEFRIQSDDGGDNVYIQEDGETLIISKDLNLNGEFPEPDLLVWRTPDKFEAWKADLDEGEGEGEGEIQFKSFKYDIGDERAFGRLEFEADTPKGILKYEANINTDGEMEDEAASLDGQPTEIQLSVHLPHYYKIDPSFWTYTEEEEEEEREEQPSDEEAKQIVAEGINYWIEEG